jgi:phosphatidylglycerophosphate synthase
MMTILSENGLLDTCDGEGKPTLTDEAVRGSGLIKFLQLVKSALVSLILVGGAVGIASIGLVYAGYFSRFSAGFSLAAYLLSGMFILGKLESHPYPRFGAANTITAIRAGITCLIGGILFGTETFMEPVMAWGLVAATALALCLDGVDGYAARYSGTNSDFGARYDMEVDAALIFCLSVLAFLLGKAGWWVILIGVMRYLFVAAQYFVPRLRGKLMPSFRRQIICVVQVVCLGSILLPIIEPPISMMIAALGLLALSYSFAHDIVNLLCPMD